MMRNLGVFINADHSEVKHPVTSGLLVALHVLHSIRQLVPSSVNRNVYTALVLASLNYGNATLPGLPSYQLSHL